VEYQLVGFADNYNILDKNITAIKGTQTLLYIVGSLERGME